MTEDDRHPIGVVFATLWALALVFHVIAALETPLDAVLLAAACLLIALPRDPRLLLGASLLQIGSLVWLFPATSNHWVLAGFVSLTIITAAATPLVSSNTLPSTSQLIVRAAPAIRLELLVMYFWTVIHKLNWDFFDPAVSCGTHFVAQFLAYTWPTADPWIALNLFRAGIWGTLLIEAAIPCLLITRRTRRLGVMVAIAFHLLVSWNPVLPFFNFSATVTALAVLFLSPRDLQAVRNYLTDHDLVQSLGLRRPVRLLSVTIAVVTSAFLIRNLTHFPAYQILFTGIAITVLAALLPRGLSTDEPSALTFLPRNRWLLAFPLALFLHGATPYLGLKTDLSFEMFSNLRTAGDQTNHLFIPSQPRPFDAQSPLVRVQNTSLPALSRYAGRDVGLPPPKIAKFASEHPDETVTFSVNGESRTVTLRQFRTQWTDPTDLWALPFDAVNLHAPQQCRH